MTAVKRVHVSSRWTDEEREDVSQLITREIGNLMVEETNLRKTILWEAPCFSENQLKRIGLEQLNLFVRHSPAEFLELNRRNFEDFIE